MYLIVADVRDGYSSPRVVATAATLVDVVRASIEARADLNSAWMLEPHVFKGESPQGAATPCSRVELVQGQEDTRTTAVRVEWWGDEPHYA